MNERLELVTDFGALKSGDHTVVMACACGRTWCESTLTEMSEDENGNPGWEAEPECVDAEDGSQLVLGEYAVSTNCVYLFRVPPADATTDSATSAPARTKVWAGP